MKGRKDTMPRFGSEAWKKHFRKLKRICPLSHFQQLFFHLSFFLLHRSRNAHRHRVVRARLAQKIAVHVEQLQVALVRLRMRRRESERVLETVERGNEISVAFVNGGFEAI